MPVRFSFCLPRAWGFFSVKSCQDVLSFHQLFGDIKAEGIVAALMAAHDGAVDGHGAFLIHSAEVQDHTVLYKALGQGEDLAVMEVIGGLHDFLDTGQQGLGGIGNQNGAIIAVRLGRLVDAVVPLAVQVQVAVTDKARSGIFGKRIGCADFCCPSAFQLNHVFSP